MNQDQIEDAAAAEISDFAIENNYPPATKDEEARPFIKEIYLIFPEEDLAGQCVATMVGVKIDDHPIHEEEEEK